MHSIKKHSKKSIKKKSIKKKFIKIVKGGACIEFDVIKECVIKEYSDYVENDNGKFFTEDSRIVVNSEINDKSIGVSFYDKDKNIIFNFTAFDYDRC